jgi:hypothetical protein
MKLSEMAIENIFVGLPVKSLTTGNTGVVSSINDRNWLEVCWDNHAMSTEAYHYEFEYTEVLDERRHNHC